MTPSMEPSKTFTAWATKHATIFSLLGESEWAMLSSWQPILESAGYTLEELDDATYYMASQKALATAAEHLPAIQNRIKATREILSKEELMKLQKESWQSGNEWTADIKKRWNAFVKKANAEHPPPKRKGLGKI